MSARSIRRAAQHEALKAARKAAAPESTVAEPITETESSPQLISPAQLAANRANAQLSCGPKTEPGKLKSSHNALKTGLTGRTILLPTDDVAAYQTLVALINEKLAPATDVEKLLVQTIADTEWRLLRIPTLESGLYALGRVELAAECPHEPDATLRAAMLEAHIFRTCQKDLRNLALQERRLRNQLREDTAELRRLQHERLEKQDAAPKDAIRRKPAPNGFVFSTRPARTLIEIPPSPAAAPESVQPDDLHLKSEANAA